MKKVLAIILTLAAIAAVSRIDIMTRTAESPLGASLSVEGGVFGEVEEAGCPLGTTIVVRDLFYNTPARLKFMKSDSAEASAVSAVLQQISLSHPETGDVVHMLPQYKELFLRNSDIIGWIAIEGTKIDYPVVQRKQTQDYYIHRNFYREYASRGCIYAREECDVMKPSDNVVLYGHMMKDATMFADLNGYKYEKFWKEVKELNEFKEVFLKLIKFYYWLLAVGHWLAVGNTSPLR